VSKEHKVAIWDGITKSMTLDDRSVKTRHELSNLAKAYHWPKMLKLLGEYPDLINTTRPDGQSLYTPLHQAAHGGASVEVVRQMIKMGAWRTIKNAKGEYPVDVAQKRKHHHLVSILKPEYKRSVSPQELRKIQNNFHTIIRERADHLVAKHALRLPELEALLEMKEPKMWFSIPGMYGGFIFWLETMADGCGKLITESWFRVSDTPGQRHEITYGGSKLVTEAFQKEHHLKEYFNAYGGPIDSACYGGAYGMWIDDANREFTEIVLISRLVYKLESPQGKFVIAHVLRSLADDLEQDKLRRDSKCELEKIIEKEEGKPTQGSLFGDAGRMVQAYHAIVRRTEMADEVGS